jgi:hypothetical protein
LLASFNLSWFFPQNLPGSIFKLLKFLLLEVLLASEIVLWHFIHLNDFIILIVIMMATNEQSRRLLQRKLGSLWMFTLLFFLEEDALVCVVLPFLDVVQSSLFIIHQLQFLGRQHISQQRWRYLANVGGFFSRWRLRR